MRSKSGFTIVELLIVIVVIGILAAVTIVAYNGIQQRATNTSITSSVGQTAKLITAYKALYGTYPFSSSVCLTTDNQCTSYLDAALTSDNSSAITELKKVGQPVSTMPQTASNTYGIYLDYYPPRTFNHANAPALLMFTLKGANQDCKIANVAIADPSPLPGETNAFISSTNGYTSVNPSGNTRCWVSI